MKSAAFCCYGRRAAEEIALQHEPAGILIVDDDEIVRINLIAYLEDEDFTPLGAASGEEALRIVERRQVDVAVVDMRLPGMDGNTLIRKARRLRPNLRFLIHTGSIDFSLPEELRELGVRSEHVFFKPIPRMELFKEAVEELAREARSGGSTGGPGEASRP
jgi:CheY-like chemotaxis protein